MNIKNIKTIFPGDTVPNNTLNSFSNTALLFGDLIQLNDSYYICSKSKRYLPNKDDIVIGKIIYRTIDFYRIDLGYGITGFLPSDSFHLATKRNRPDLTVGEYVMAKILRVKDYPLLQCEEGMGKIEGYVFDLGCYNVKRIIVQGILEQVGQEYNFKMGLGVNGIVYVGNEDLLVVRSIVNKIRSVLGMKNHASVYLK